MERTKLSHLTKNLSEWQQNQKMKNYQNSHFFLQQSEPMKNPWEHYKGFQTSMNYKPTKREMNQILKNNKSEETRKMFNNYR